MIAIQTWLPLLLILLLPLETYTEFLKSKGSIKVLEGEELEMDWIAYSESDRFEPCSWSYAPNTSAVEKVFLAYEDGNRYEFGTRHPWQFTSTQEPCKGGIRRTAQMIDTGVYRMKMSTGYSLNTGDTQTNVTVYRGSDLGYVISVNTVEYEFSLQNGTNSKLSPVVTNEPVHVKVALNAAFPSSTKVTVSRDSQKEACGSPSEECDNVINVSNSDDTDVIITIETGIQGADLVTITQPVTYDTPVDNSHKNAAILFGILFFLLLVALIVLIVLLIMTNRKTRKAASAQPKKDDVETGDKAQEAAKASMIDRAKRKAQVTAQDFVSAFKPKNERKQAVPIDDLNDCLEKSSKEVSELKLAAEESEKAYATQMKGFEALEQGTRYSLTEALDKCHNLRDYLNHTKEQMEDKKKSDAGLTEVEHQQYTTIKHLINQAQASHDHLTWLNGDLDRCLETHGENNDRIKQVKDDMNKLARQSAVREENANDSQCDLDDETKEDNAESEKLNPSKVESEHADASRKLVEIQNLHKQILLQKTLMETLDFMKVDLERKAKDTEAKKCRIVTIDDNVHEMKQKYNAVKSGWDYGKTSPTSSSPDPTPAHSAAVTETPPVANLPSDGPAPQRTKSKGIKNPFKRKSSSAGDNK